MAELTNLTDRITHLRDRKGDTGGAPPPSKPGKGSSVTSRQRAFAPDSFMLFVYVLLGVALVAQLALIVWLDVI